MVMMVPWSTMMVVMVHRLFSVSQVLEERSDKSNEEGRGKEKEDKARYGDIIEVEEG